nr:RluA family pseudouridine synthase [Anaerolineae bacterium]
MSDQLILLVPDSDGERLDKYVASSLPGTSRTHVQHLVESGHITVNNEPTRSSYRLVSGDVIRVNLPAAEPDEVFPQRIDLDILYEDDTLCAINKPAGMVVHPAYGNRTGTLVNAALAHWPQMRGIGGNVERSGVVHRLDKETSGVIVLAKNEETHAALQEQFKQRSVYKRYLALVEGLPTSTSGVIEAPIGRDQRQRKMMSVQPGGREAATRYDLVEDLGTHALLSLEPYTGRTHQIRVHLSWLGHPVVGDRVYGYRKQRIKMKRFFLHAAELHIDSPSTGERLKFSAPMPAHLEDTLAKLRRNLGAPWED